MTIDEAIKINTDLAHAFQELENQDASNAVKLGEEALKRLQELRRLALNSSINLLPGETTK